jgi:multiple sugar transport system permease protein
MSHVSPHARARNWWTLSRRDAASGYLFVFPQAAGFVIFVAVPVAIAIWYSLYSYNMIYGNPLFVGLDNYRAIFSDPEMASVAAATLIITIGYVPLNVILGLALALLANGAFRGIGLIRTAIFAPVAITTIAWTVVWKLILAPDGILNSVLVQLGADASINWLFDDNWARFWIVVVMVLKSAGVSMAIFLAALQNVPVDLHEAATLDGANKVKTFFHITLPLISPFVFLMTVLSSTEALKAFAVIYWLTGGGPGSSTKTLSYYIYDQAFRRFELGYSSSLTVVLLAVVLLLTAAQFSSRKKWVYGE